VHGVGILAVLIHETLRGHAGIGAVVHQARRIAVPRGGTAAPRVVAVRGGHHDAGPVGIAGKGRNIGVNQTLLPARVARLVALNIVGRHQHDGLFGARFGIHILRLVQLIGKGGQVPRRLAHVARAEPPTAGCGGSDLIRFVGRAGENIEAALGVGFVVVARTGAAQVMAGHDGPLVALFHQHINHVTGKRHFGGEEALGAVGDAAGVPGLVGRLVKNLEFFAENRLGQNRAQRMVVGEPDQIQLATAVGSRPRAGFPVAVPPVAAVAQLVVRAQAPHIVHKRTGIAHGVAALIHARHRIARPVLVGLLAVIHAENGVEIVLGMLSAGVVGLEGLQHDGVPRKLHPAGLTAVAVPFRPVEGLVVMPETGNFYVVVGHGRRRPEHSAQHAQPNRHNHPKIHPLHRSTLR
jgi:hypothetical protein